MTAAALAIAVAYVIGRLQWPRWAYWTLSIACFAGSAMMAVLLNSWNADPHWTNAICVGLAAVAGSTASFGFQGGRIAQQSGR